jgi:4-diphosphocytidyl-2-C-methyl-D-erythritol kinase
MRELTIDAPAKLNLRLKIQGRRSDGYHLLEMWNVLTSFSDTLVFRKQQDGIHIEQIGGPEIPLESNLIFKAAKAVLEHYGVSGGVGIRIEKRIPVGAGLGGGSSDAAATLRGVLELYGVSDGGALDSLALELGADVPYFLRGTPALVTGIGEIITPIRLDYLRGVACLLIFPDVSLATSLMYKGQNAPFIEQQPPACALPQNYIEFLELLENDFENMACEMSSLVRDCLQRLGGSTSLFGCLTGSGSAIYVLPRDQNMPTQELKLRVEKSLVGIDVDIQSVELRV